MDWAQNRSRVRQRTSKRPSSSRTAVSNDSTRRRLSSVWILPRVRLAGYCVDYAVAVPADHGIGVVLQCFREFTVGVAVAPHADNSLANFLCVLDFPIYPSTVFRLWGYIDNKDTCPSDLRRQDF